MNHLLLILEDISESHIFNSLSTSSAPLNCDEYFKAPLQPRPEEEDLFELQQQEADAVQATTKPDSLRRPFVSFEVPPGSGRPTGRDSAAARGSGSGSGSGDYDADAESDSAARRSTHVQHSHKSRSSIASTPATFASEALPGEDLYGSGSGRADSNEEDEADIENAQLQQVDADEFGAVEKQTGKQRKVLYQVASGKRTKSKEKEGTQPSGTAPEPNAPADPAEREYTETDLQSEMRAVESRHHISFNRLKSIMLATVSKKTRCKCFCFYIAFL